MDKLNLGKLTTESRNQDTLDIDKISTIEMVKKINNEDKGSTSCRKRKYHK